MNNSARQKGFVAPPLLIGGVAVVLIIVFLVATGALKFSGSIRVDDQNKPRENTQSVSDNNTPTATPTEKPKPSVKLFSEPFADAKLGFSVSYPEGWKVREDTSAVTFFKPSETKGADQADALVSIVSGALGELKDTKLATIADLHKVYIKKQFDNVEFTGETDVKVNSQDGYELEFTGSVKGEKMHARYIVLKGDKYLYAIIGMANTGLWDNEKETIEASVQTFKIQ